MSCAAAFMSMIETGLDKSKLRDQIFSCGETPALARRSGQARGFKYESQQAVDS